MEPDFEEARSVTSKMSVKKRHMKAAGINMSKLEETAQNRQAWREAIRSGMKIVKI
jgi:hypothetical protein